MTLTAELGDFGKLLSALNAYKSTIGRKSDELRHRIADEMKSNAKAGFNGAPADTAIAHSDKMANVDVDWRDDGSITVVFTEGEDAIWAEFGAGVWFNGSAGSSPHPKGAELGMIIGSYGKGNGKKETWRYKDADGNVYETHGTPASMPMWNAYKDVIDRLPAIASEVFRDERI